MIEHAVMYLTIQNVEYASILNVSDAVHSLGSQYKLLSSYRGRDVLRTLPGI